MIDRAYRTAEGLGIPLWCEDEAGPYQAIPQPGTSWQPKGMPAHRPHEYVRGGTAKLLTLFRPATGEVRAQPTERTPNAVLHPSLRGEWTAHEESPEEFRARIVDALEVLIGKHTGDRIAVVCHGGVINGYLSYILGLANPQSFFYPNYTSIHRVAAARRVRARFWHFA